jgi:8-oxo-dGTP pyrophosphatase MutT (NUDIX family)
MGEEARQWVAVTVLVFRGDRMLSMKRASTQGAGLGLWEGVSGRVRVGEDPAAAAYREVIEETGLRVKIHARPVTAYAALRGSEPMTVIVFGAQHEAGEVALSEEHDAYRWSELAELSALGVPARLVDAARKTWPAG